MVGAAVAAEDVESIDSAGVGQGTVTPSRSGKMLNETVNEARDFLSVASAHFWHP